MSEIIENLRRLGHLDAATRIANRHKVTVGEMVRPPRVVTDVKHRAHAARREFVQGLLDKGWSVSAAASLLGLNHTTLLHSLGRLKKNAA